VDLLVVELVELFWPELRSPRRPRGWTWVEPVDWAALRRPDDRGVGDVQGDVRVEVADTERLGDGYRAGFSASTTIDRSDHGVDVKLPLDAGGVAVCDQVQITLEIAAALRYP
jgi:hypothetical protein